MTNGRRHRGLQRQPEFVWSTGDALVGKRVGGKRVGGINVFGGGLTLYRNRKKVGAIGVSGGTSCTDHVVAGKVRQAASLPLSGRRLAEMLTCRRSPPLQLQFPQ